MSFPVEMQAQLIKNYYHNYNIKEITQICTVGARCNGSEREESLVV